LIPKSHLETRLENQGSVVLFHSDMPEASL